MQHPVASYLHPNLIPEMFRVLSFYCQQQQQQSFGWSSYKKILMCYRGRPQNYCYGFSGNSMKPKVRIEHGKDAIAGTHVSIRYSSLLCKTCKTGTSGVQVPTQVLAFFL